MDRLARAVPAAILGLLYLALGARDWGEHDAAEIAAAAATLGIVHPPGYPLFLLPAHLLYRAGGVPSLLLLSAIPAAAALHLLSRLAEREGARPSAAIAAAAAIGLSPFLLDMALQVEVYALHLLLLVLLEGAVRDLDRRPIRFFLLLGLSLAHHIGILILLPAYLPEIAAWVRARVRAGAAGAGRAAASASVALVPLGAYLLLPSLYSRAGEFVFWGPVSWDGLFHYATGGPFRVWMFRDSFAAGAARSIEAAGLLFENLPLLAWPLALWGLATVTGAGPRLRAAWFVVVPILHLGTYAVIDLPPFLTPALLPIGLGLARGIDRARDRIGPERAAALPALVAVLGVLSAWTNPALFRYRSDYPARYARAILARYPDGTEIRANWRLYPVLRALQIVERRGRGLRVALAPSDTVPAPTGSIVLAPTRARGETQALLFDGLAWRVATAAEIESAPLAPGTGRPPARELGGGVAVLGGDFPARAEAAGDAPVTGRIAFVRGRDGAAPGRRFWFHLQTEDSHAVYRLPLEPIAWHLPPDRWDAGAVYFEPAGALLAPGLAPGNYRWVLRNESAGSIEEFDLGPLEVSERTSTSGG